LWFFTTSVRRVDFSDFVFSLSPTLIHRSCLYLSFS
jgi:hypothetical protein